MDGPAGRAAIPPGIDLPGGAIDRPAGGTVLPRAAVRIAGWAATSVGSCSRVELTIDNRRLGRARLGRYRPDVARATGRPHAAFSGFELLADLSLAGCSGPSITLGGWGVGLEGDLVELPKVALELADETPPGRPEQTTSWRPRLRAGRHSGPGPIRVLVCSHDLGYGGAPLVLAELVRTIGDQHQIAAEVLSFAEGPVRGLFERLDLDVHVRQPVVDDSGVDYEQSIGELCEWLATRRYDVALVNTVVAFPAADACLRLGIPTAWAIHESYPLPLIAPTFRISPTGAARLEAALRSATKLVFVSEATRRLYQAYLPATPCVTLPYGVDIDGLDGWRTGFDTGRTRSGIRGLDAVGKLILCVGAITPRKGQVPLVQAFATIADRHPGALLQFVGAFRGTLPGGLSAVAAAYGIEDRVLVEPEVADVRPWYASADLLVSASEVESLPRSMLEAMALGLPVLGTAVFGVPELITDGETGWLCEPNDVGALADSLDRVLSLDPAERERVARNAHLKVRDEYRSDLRSPAWGELLSELARG